jgi:hypothetical protein
MFSLLRKLLGAALLVGAGAAIAGCMLNRRQRESSPLPGLPAAEDGVDDASDDSFPASDPPSRTAVTGTGSAH